MEKGSQKQRDYDNGCSRNRKKVVGHPERLQEHQAYLQFLVEAPFELGIPKITSYSS